MMHRIRLAMQCQSFENFGTEGGTVEVDETYIGGLARNMHKSKREAKFHGRTGGAGKIAVFGLLDRRNGQSKVRTQVIPDSWKETVNGIINQSLEKGSNVYSDEHGAYFTSAKKASIMPLCAMRKSRSWQCSYQRH